MIIVNTKVDDEKIKVQAVYTDESIISNVDIDTLPLPENKPSKNAVLYIKPETNELFYEYEGKP